MRINTNISLYGKEGEIYTTRITTKSDQLGRQLIDILQDELESYINSDEIGEEQIDEDALRIFESFNKNRPIIYDLKAGKPGELKMKFSSNVLFNQDIYLNVYITYSVSEMNKAFLDDIAIGLAEN